MWSRTLLIAWWIVAFSVATPAQPYPGDLIQITPGRVPSPPHTYGGLFHVNPRGQLRTIAVGHSYSDLTMDYLNRDLVVAWPTGIKVIQPLTNATVSTIWNGPPLMSLQALTPIHTGDFVVAANNWTSSIHVFHVRSDGSRITTLRVLPMNPNWHGYRQDLVTGQIVESTASGFKLFPITGGPATTLYSGNVYFFAQDHVDGSFVFTDTAGLMRFDRVKGLTTIRAGPGYYAPAIDRASGRGEIVTGLQGTLLRLDRHGVVITSYPNACIGLRMCFLEGRNLVSRRLTPGLNRWEFRLDFPGEGRRAHVLGLSYTGFTPGIPLGARRVPLVPDPLLALTVTGGFSAFLKGNIGFLDSGGSATAVLDVSALGVSLKGVRLWAAAITLDPAAPLGIATISKPIIVVLN
jgi:hypothetical protein